MKKIMIFCLYLSSISYALNIQGQVKIGSNAAFGAENITYPISQLNKILKVALPRENTLNEGIINYNDRINQISSIVNSFSDSKINVTIDPNDPTIYVNSQNDVDLLLSKRYVKRGVIFDNTLIDAKLKVNDIGTEFGVVLKNKFRPDQKCTFDSCYRDYLYLNTDTVPIKIKSRYYIHGYQDGTPGFNALMEGENIKPKENGTFDFNTIFSVLKTAIRPNLYLDLEKTPSTTKYSLGPSLTIDLYKNENNLFTVTTSAYTSNNYDDFDNYDVLKEIKSFAPGVDKIEYFKNWELNAIQNPIMQTDEENKKYAWYDSRNTDSTKRDIQKGELDGMLGSMRAVGTPTGALYGDSVVKKVIDLGFENLSDNIGAANENVNDFFSDVNILKYFKRKYRNNVIELGNKIKNNEDDINGKIIRGIGSDVLDLLNIPYNGKFSDFNPTYLVPSEYSDFLYGLLKIVPINTNYPNVVINNHMENTEDYVEKFTYDNSIVVPVATRNAIFNDPDIKELLNSTVKIMKVASKNKDILNAKTFIEKINGIFNITTDAIKENAISNFRTIRQKLIKLRYEPEQIRGFDMFAGLQFNQSEKDYVSKEYVNKYLELIGEKTPRELFVNNEEQYPVSVKNRYLYGIKSDITYKNKSGFSFETGIEYEKYKKEKSRDYSSLRATLIPETNELKEIRKSMDPENTEVWYSKSDPLHWSPYEYTYEYAYKQVGSISKIDQSLLNFNFNSKYEGSNLKSEFLLNIKNMNYKEFNRSTFQYYYDKSWKNAGKVGKIKKKSYEFNKFRDADIDFASTDFDLSALISYKYDFNDKWSITPTFAWMFHNTYNKYKGITYKEYDDQNVFPGEDKELTVQIYDRKDDKVILKSDVDTVVGTLKAGPIDISKYSKYLRNKNDIRGDNDKSLYKDGYIFAPNSRYLESKQAPGHSSWDKPTNIYVFGLNLSYKPTKELTISYDFKSPLKTIEKGIDGFYLSNAVSLQYNF